MFDTRATEYGRAQRVLCSGIEPSDPYTPATVGLSQLCASIETIRPTQITVGFREVEAKRRRYREAFAAGGPAFPRVPVPVILGPGSMLFALDRHHWLCALRAEGVYEVAIRVVDDLSGLDPPSGPPGYNAGQGARRGSDPLRPTGHEGSIHVPLRYPGA